MDSHRCIIERDVAQESAFVLKCSGVSASQICTMSLQFFLFIFSLVCLHNPLSCSHSFLPPVPLFPSFHTILISSFLSSYSTSFSFLLFIFFICILFSPVSSFSFMSYSSFLFSFFSSSSSPSSFISSSSSFSHSSFFSRFSSSFPVKEVEFIIFVFLYLFAVLFQSVYCIFCQIFIATISKDFKSSDSVFLYSVDDMYI